ncbi:MAG: cobaltochelatase subunit CobN [Spirulina sp. SIO3F2]|nr:cobaltochelatase subunit CobN [Spirulina sp. SIO3F2]
MHRIAATPGGWTPELDGVILIEQNPAPIVFLTSADTEIQTLAAALPQLSSDFPAIRALNLLQLQQPFSIDDYGDTVLRQARVIILRLLGGRAYWSYGLEVVKEFATETGAALFVLPGDDRPDPDLMSHSTVALTQVHQLWQYLLAGGVANVANGLRYAANVGLGREDKVEGAIAVPKIGHYVLSLTPLPEGTTAYLEAERSGGQLEIQHHQTSVTLPVKPGCQGASPPTPPAEGAISPSDSCNRGQYLESLRGVSSDLRAAECASSRGGGKGLLANDRVGILFYRAHYLAGNTRAIDALCITLQQQNLTPVPVFISSLQDPEVQAALPEFLDGIQVLLNTTSFSLAKLGQEEQPQLWSRLNVPVIQTILSGGTVEQWEQSFQGLNPRDVAMNVALPEVDGRIISRAISFKTVDNWHKQLETDVVVYQPQPDRVAFVSQLAARWVRLAQTTMGDRKVGLILANYPNKDGRLANGVGLDTPASCVAVLQAMRAGGYAISALPDDGDDLIAQLTAGITNDPEGHGLRPVQQTVSAADYQAYFVTLPEEVQTQIRERWGDVPTEDIAIAGIQLGNIFVGIQPSRGYDVDPSLNYHAPDLEPTHHYLAYYYWLEQQFCIDAIVHLGKHGNLEWLPGKSLALSEDCYPEVALGPVPNFYPFIVNDPGEGSQAKRRSQAVILDHLTPPLTRAELYGELQAIEGLIDEYYEAQTLDPSRLALIGDRITAQVQAANLHQDLGIDEISRETLAEFLTCADGYLCELKEAQIRDGLHIFGQCPTGTQLRDLMVAIARSPAPGRLGLTQAIWQDLIPPADADPLSKGAVNQTPLTKGGWGDQGGVCQEATSLMSAETRPTPRFAHPSQEGINSETPLPKGGWGDFDPLDTDYGRIINLEIQGQPCRTVGDAVAVLEDIANQIVETGDAIGPETTKVLTWLNQTLRPQLQATSQEITNLLRGLNGEYIPSGPSGAPTRGRPEVLPTGRNFYSVDIRAIPTETAWSVGRKAAEQVIERYTQEEGDYPQSLALSVWGTATMRTGGDDIAQALALLGVQPVWDGRARRVVDFEILPLSVLGRPRVDVTLRISGFFRDSFPNLIDLCDRAIAAVAQLDEPPDQNPLAAQVRRDQATWQAQGLTPEQAATQAQYRIFGSKPGAYGAGLQGLIEAQNWTTDADLARAYINWSSYAYTGSGQGHTAPAAFEQRLSQLQIVLHNQDNREHDLLDSDDYYQFQGGLTAAVRSIQGQNPITYFGDHSRPEQPRVRKLTEEVARVYRSRVINPKWIAGVMRHGYKGAFELAATVDYLFAYDATAQCVEDFMYEGVARSYLLDEVVQGFVAEKNPWALRDMAERLLEASQRGLWQQADPEVLAQLRNLVHDAEAQVENTLGG